MVSLARSRRVSTALICLLLFGVAPMAQASVSWSFQGVTQTIDTGSIALSSPAAASGDAAGNVYIADTGNNRIVKVNEFGSASVFTITGLSPALTAPGAVTIDGSGNLYIADTGNSRVVKVTSAGAGSVISLSSVTISSPKGIALDQAGDLFIADTGNNRIVEVISGGAASALTITGLSSPSTLNTPKGLAVDNSGNLYITDSANSRIVKVAAGGAAGTVVSISGVTLGASPSSVAVDSIGNLYIADTSNNRVAQVDTAGNSQVLQTYETVLSGPLGVAVSVLGTVYVADTGDNHLVVVDPPVLADITAADPLYSLNKSAVGFGHVQLGSPTPVSLTLPFTIGYSPVLGSVKVFTAGAQNKDFTLDQSTTCTANSSGTSCVVKINFLPTAPGLRTGAVVLFSNGTQPSLRTDAVAPNEVPTPPAPVMTIPIFGYGDSPVAALAPNPATVINTGGVINQLPFQLALDGLGNMYLGNYVQDNSNPKVVKVPAGGGTASAVSTAQVTLGDSVTGIALDGAGNLFIADYYDDRIVVVTPGGVASVLAINGLSPTLGQPTELAFDAAGDLYIADYEPVARVVRVSSLSVSGSTSSGLGQVIKTGTYTFAPASLTGVAVAPDATVYIAARTANSSHIIQVTGTGVVSEVTPTGFTFSNPQGAFVDGMGNFYVEDAGNSRIVRITAAGVASALSVSGLTAPANLASGFGVTVDASGNFYIPDWTNSRIVYVSVSGAALTFATTNVESTSTDSPKTATVTNLGNLSLDFSANPSYYPNFSNNSADTTPCTSSSSLLSGTVCDVSVKFTPQSAGSLSAGIIMTNNNLNVAGSAQQVSVSGIGVSSGDSTSTAVAIAPTSLVPGQTATITVTVSDTTAGHTSTVPTGPVTFTDTFGTTITSLHGGTPVNLSAGQAVLNGVVLTGIGTHTVAANYAGVNGSYYSSTKTITVTLNQATPAIALTSSVNPVMLNNPTTLTATVSSPAGTPTGTVSFLDGTTPLGQGMLSGGSATLTVASLSVGTHTITAASSGDTTFTAVSSSALTQTVLDFTLGSSNSSGTPLVTVIPGGMATYVLALAPTTGAQLPAPLTLSVSGLPVGATAALAPSTWTVLTSTSWSIPANSPLAATLTIQLPTATSSLDGKHGSGGTLPPILWGILLLPFAGRLRRAGKGLRRTIAVLLLSAAAAAAGLSGCASATGLLSQQPATYTVTVTATSGTLSHSTTVSLTVE